MGASAKKKILVVEDEPHILEGIKDALELQDFEVVASSRGDEALTKAILSQPDLIILDIMLPKLSGLDICENLRASGIKAPIIFLTAKGRESDRIEGLEKGADDYMTKPFSIRELLARVNAHLRRIELDRTVAAASQPAEPAPAPSEPRRRVIEVKHIKIDFDARTCWRNGEELHLTEKEFLIMRILTHNLGKVVDRDTLLKEAWSYHDLDMETRTVDVTIGKLRHKIERDAARPEIIKTKRGKGYIIEDAG